MIALLNKRLAGELDGSAVRKKSGAFLGGTDAIIYAVLTVLKIMAALLTGSVIVMLDMVNTFGCALFSYIQYCAYKGSDESEFSAEKRRISQSVWGIASSVGILIFASTSVHDICTHIIVRDEIVYSPVAAVVIALSVFICVYMYSYNCRAAEMTKSSVLQSSGYTALICGIISTCVVISAIAQEHFGLYLDGILGVFVFIYIVQKCVSMLYEIVRPLLCDDIDPGLITKIGSFVMSYDDIIGVHDFEIVNSSGGKLIVTLHVEVLDKCDIKKICDTVDNIEKRLENVLGCKATIHIDLVSTDSEATFRMNRLVTLITKSIDESLNVECFRMTATSSHINIMFDVIAPSSLAMKDLDIKGQLENKIIAIPGNLVPYIEVERR